MLLTASFILAALPDSHASGRVVKVNEKPGPVRAAVQRALSFLAANQNVDGSWGSGNYDKHAGITGLAGMALLSNGSTPREGPYALRLRRALRYVVSVADPKTGLIRSPGHDAPAMYGHGFAVLFLAEAYGMSDNAALPQVLRKAVALIIDAQHRDGGWRYEPSPAGNSDLSVTVCQLMALRAARNAGIAVPKGTIDAAIEYVKKSANPNGAFRYMIQLPQNTTFALTAAGVTALYSAGVYDLPELRRGVLYLDGFLRRNGYRAPDYFFYGHYYAAQAMFQSGRATWHGYYRGIGAALLKRQRPDGGWNSKHGDVFGAAAAAIILQMPNQYLPIYER